VIPLLTNLGFLIVIDSMTTMVSLSQTSDSNLDLTAFFLSILQPTPSTTSAQPIQVSVVSTYHTDVLLPKSPSASSKPHPLALLSYLATTIITVHSLSILLAGRAAVDKSLAAPSFGLASDVEGILIGIKPKHSTTLASGEGGVVLELEHRRKSGRGVKEWFFLPESSPVKPGRENVILLDDHPLFQIRKTEDDGAEDDLTGMTFELGLTERQRLEREGVVLPYFDAQKAVGGVGEGGRILYDLGVEDDFDEEEDEI
jgi:elongator complex protein 5